ncbi:adenine deaminase C-terminal domain-containing protein, partial [Pseudoalteromonas sp. SIMBA_162]|uniref:adenine deaminase C-terminal domain-containing protein n=1 Tax=Pseudoalteromonas sp. SIMBA_162 TaxID=3080867 RepID=UPI00397DA93A
VKLQEVHDALHEVHQDIQFHLFLTVSFLSLPVIPELKIITTGLFDVKSFQHIPVEVVNKNTVV